jgi:four helix bundle protein
VERANFKERTKAFALRVVKLVDARPNDSVARTLGLQLLCSAAPVAANYRAAMRGKLRADFIAKRGTVEEECDEPML